MMRRRGPGLMRAAATTAVVAGTAGAVRHHQDQKYANQAGRAAAGSVRPAGRGRAGSGSGPRSAPAAPSAGDDMMAQLTQLSQLHNAGVLSDDEFAAAKAKLLA